MLLLFADRLKFNWTAKTFARIIAFKLRIGYRMRSNRLENNTKVCSIGAIQARIRNNKNIQPKWNEMKCYSFLFPHKSNSKLEEKQQNFMQRKTFKDKQLKWIIMNREKNGEKIWKQKLVKDTRTSRDWYIYSCIHACMFALCCIGRAALATYKVYTCCFGFEGIIALFDKNRHLSRWITLAPIVLSTQQEPIVYCICREF